MLVLSRKQLEALRIGDSIEVTVLEVRKGRVRLGICAPRDVSVMRLELQEGAHRALPGTVSAARSGSSMARTEETAARLEQGLQYSIPSAV